MYDVDERDRVCGLEGVPDSEPGAPMPLVVADDFRTVLAYIASDAVAPTADSPSQTQTSPAGAEPFALVTFDICYAHMFGPPNDEAIAGHPLHRRGVVPYGAFEVLDSSWIRKLERMNSVHPRHRPERFLNRRHLIFTFHDSTFECVCDGFQVTRAHGWIDTVVPQMVKLLG
jgi:hypothetical protein